MSSSFKIGQAVPLVRRSATVDWLTITVKDDLDRKKALLHRFVKTQEAIHMAGEHSVPWQFKGYKGVQVGSARWGTRDDSDIVVVSGVDAATYWRVFAPLATNVTRVDLAVTVESRRCLPRLIKSYRDHLLREAVPAARKYVTVESVDGIGQTLYVGSRHSDAFGRLYDKGAQMKDPLLVHRLWRYEVEYKREQAEAVVKRLLECDDVGRDAPVEDVSLATIIHNTVWWWFDDCLIPPVFEVTSGPVAYEISTRVTSDEQKLLWLRKQVRPSVKSLSENGHLDEVLYALGLIA